MHLTYLLNCFCGRNILTLFFPVGFTFYSHINGVLGDTQHTAASCRNNLYLTVPIQPSSKHTYAVLVEGRAHPRYVYPETVCHYNSDDRI